jgi:protein kinase G-like protein
VTCTRPGCGGTIQDGYCDTGGLAAATPSAPSVPSGSAGTASGPFSGSPSSRSRSRRTSGPSARGRLADGRLGQLGVDDLRREQLTVEILRAALDWCGTGQPTGKSPIAGCEPNARALRFGLERCYRALARLTPDEDRRIELVDMANAIRPRTLT